MAGNRARMIAFAIMGIVMCGSMGWAAPAKEPAKPAVPVITTVNYTEAVDFIKEDAPVLKYVEEKFGVKLKILHIPTEERATKLGLMAASGEFPDVLWLGQDEGARSFYEQGALGEFDRAVMQKYAPKAYASIIEEQQTFGYDPWLQYIFGKNPSGVPPVDTKIDWRESVYSRSWRLDLLKELGISDVPRTLADMEEIGRRQVAKDPRIYMIGGSAKQTYNQCFSDIYNAFAYNPGDSGVWIYKDGKITNVLMMPQLKDALRQLADWFAKGYIDPEYLNQGWDDHAKQFVNGQVLSHTWSHITYDWPEGGYLYNLLKGVNPKGEIKWAPWVLGPDGNTNGWQTGNRRASNGGHFFSKAMVADALKMRKYFEMVEANGSDEETTFTMNYGIKGINWDPDPVVGAKLRDQKFSQPPAINEIGNTRFWGFLLSVNTHSNKLKIKYMEPNMKAWYAYAKAQTDKYGIKMEKIWSNAAITQFPSDLRRLESEIKPLVREYIDSIILNKKPIDAWDEFTQKWWDGGGKQLTEFRNANDLKYYK